MLYAQTNPGELEDAREERLKILKAADQIDLIQNSSEKLRGDVDSLKDQVAKLQEANISLQQQIADLKSAIQKSEEARAKEREVLLTKVGDLIAANKPPPAPEPKKEPKVKEPTASAPGSPDASTEHESQHGFYHTVEKGETLSVIAAAYNDHGIKVTVDDIRKANNLNANSVLKIGQKIFIPKK